MHKSYRNTISHHVFYIDSAAVLIVVASCFIGTQRMVGWLKGDDLVSRVEVVQGWRQVTDS